MLTEQNIELFKEAFIKLFSVDANSFDVETEDGKITEIYCLNKGVGILIDDSRFFPYGTYYDHPSGCVDIFELGDGFDSFHMAMIELLKKVIIDEFDVILDGHRYEEQNEFLF